MRFFISDNRLKINTIFFALCIILFIASNTNIFSIVFFLVSASAVFFFRLSRTAYDMWQLSKLPGIKENGDRKIGNFYLREVGEIAEDVVSKMNPSVRMDIRTVNSVFFQMATTLSVYKIFFRNKNLLLIHEGLLHILSKNELKAVIAHEAGHHIAPETKSHLHNEYWADYYACKYDNPVALANALIKIDQNNYLFNVFLQRCVHLCDLFIERKYINYELWDFVFENIDLPLKSKNDANNKARHLILSYILKKDNRPVKRNFIKKFFFIMRKKRNINILSRKELSKLTFIDWSHYDIRIKNEYLDKYELIKLYNTLKRNSGMTVSRFHFSDSPDSTHPNTNRRLIFIVENFLLENTLTEKSMKGNAMQCPKCGSDMKPVSYNNVEIDRCVNCEGIWFDMLEHEELKKMKGSEVIDTGSPEKGREFNKIDKIICPRCRSKMIRMVDNKQPHIWYESCGVCYGVFFDAGEFKDFKEHSISDFFKSLQTKERK